MLADDTPELVAMVGVLACRRAGCTDGAGVAVDTAMDAPESLQARPGPPMEVVAIKVAIMPAISVVRLRRRLWRRCNSWVKIRRAPNVDDDAVT